MASARGANKHRAKGRDMLVINLLGITCAKEYFKIIGTTSNNTAQSAILLNIGQQIIYLMLMRTKKIDIIIYHRVCIVGLIKSICYQPAQPLADLRP